MEYKKQITTKENIKEVWTNFIKTCGYEANGGTKHLQCYDICMLQDVTLQSCLIDEVVLYSDGEIRFYRDIDTDDYDIFEEIEYDDVKYFYIDFVDAYNTVCMVKEIENSGEC